MSDRTCSMPGCDRKVLARERCSKHYAWIKSGKTSEGRRMAEPKDRLWAQVEKTDTCWLWTGALHESGYGVISLGRVGQDKRTARAHRLSYELANGPIAEGMHIDHICHVRRCVRPEHLRAVWPKQNQEHRIGTQKNNKSGYRGVTWSAYRMQWHAEVTHQRRKYHAGFFDDVEDAAEAVRLKRIELFTHNDEDRRYGLTTPTSR